MVLASCLIAFLMQNIHTYIYIYILLKFASKIFSTYSDKTVYHQHIQIYLPYSNRNMAIRPHPQSYIPPFNIQ